MGEGIAVAAHSFAEFFALFRSHVLPTFFHAALPAIAMPGVAMEAAEENSAEDEEANALPERDTAPTEDLRKQGVPQLHRDEAEDCAGNDDEENNFGSFED